MKVLLVEDNRAEAHLVDLMLSDTVKVQFDLERVASLNDGVRRLARDDVDVVLLDLNLGDSGGIATLRAVESAAPHVPIVVLSALDGENIAQEAEQIGAHDFLIKGQVDSSLLSRSLLYAFERNRALQNVRDVEARLRLLTEQFPAILWTTDCDLRFTSSLGRQLEGLGMKPDEVTGMTVMELLGTDEAASVSVEMHRRALAGEKVTSDLDWRGHHFHTHVEPLYGRAQQIIGTIGVALDVTEQHAMEQELAAAQRIQRDLLPNRVPQAAGFDIAGACYPAARCSGDYFDFIPLHGGQLAIVVADAAGHGYGPAILAASVRSCLRVTAYADQDAQEMLTAANRQLAFDAESDRFVTLFCCQLDPATRSFTYAAAGHNAFWIDAHQQLTILEMECLPLGVDETEVFPRSVNNSLHSGDLLVFVTDGVLEAQAPDGAEFGLQRMLQVMKENRDKSAREMVDALYDAVRKFCRLRPQRDDITAVVVKVLAAER